MFKSYLIALGAVTMLTSAQAQDLGTPGGETENSTAARASVLNDAQIGKVLMTINESEIDSGRVASDKAKNAEVKKYAKMMVEEHKKNREETKKIAKKANLDPKDSDTSKSIKDEAKVSNKELKKNSGTAFDKAYLSQQVQMHEKALAMIDDSLIPAAKNPELTAHLKTTQADVEKHLAHAKEIQAKLTE